MRVSEELYSLVSTFQELTYILGVIILLIAILLILKLLEKRFKKILELRKASRNIFYKREIKKLNKLAQASKPSQKTLDLISNTAREYFKEAFELPTSLEYTELMEEFKKRKKKECISFCGLMSELNYSGEEMKKDELKTAVILLQKIIEKNRIVTEQEKEILKYQIDEIEEKKNKKQEKKEKIKKSLSTFKIFSKKVLSRKETKKTQPIKSKKQKSLEYKKFKPKQKRATDFYESRFKKRINSKVKRLQKKNS